MKNMAHTTKLPAAAARGTLVLLVVVALGQLALGSSPVGAAAAKPPVATNVRAAVSGPATLITIEGTAPQTSQGSQYGQAGFVGEPINLNVVNADIRDILNYITEQYGVNFVVDASVKGVPVTINVTDVPWNFALDSTSSGADSFTGGGASGAGAGSGGDAGILPIIKRRLSTRGSIEVDSRSNTLIVTDVRDNIEAVRKLITLLDQPEPQVEIETRIVVANRSFSRDLGVQLSAALLNTRRGGGISFENGPNALPG